MLDIVLLQSLQLGALLFAASLGTAVYIYEAWRTHIY